MQTITLPKLHGAPVVTFETLMYPIGKAAKLVGVSDTTFRKWEAEGHITRNKFGMFDIHALCVLSFDVKEKDAIAKARKEMES